MSYEDFWFNFSLREFWNAIEGYIERDNRRNQESWEQTRILYAAIQNKPVYGFRINPKQPNKWLPFPWDNKGEIPDEETLKQLEEKHGDTDSSKFNGCYFS